MNGRNLDRGKNEKANAVQWLSIVKPECGESTNFIRISSRNHHGNRAGWPENFNTAL